MKIKIIMLTSFIILLSIYISITIAVLINNKAPLDIDIKIFNFIIEIRGEKYNFIYWFFRIISEFGYIWAGILLSIIILIITRFDNRFLSFIIGLLSTLLIQLIFNFSISRARPLNEYWWSHEKTYSYPSGHSAISSYIYSMILYFIIISKSNNKIKIISSIILPLIIILIIISRLILSMHYFSDVIAGATFGLIFVVISIFIHQIFINKKILNNPLIKK